MKGMIYKRLALVLAVVSVFSVALARACSIGIMAIFIILRSGIGKRLSGIARRRSRETHKHRIILALCMTKARV